MTPEEIIIATEVVGEMMGMPPKKTHLDYMMDDEEKALARYIDQPSQWVDITPASVKKRQEKDWKELEALMKESGKY